MDELPNISGFNYRIGKHKVGDHAYYRIHECFYDENRNVVFWGESSPHGESADALIADLEQMLADAKRSRAASAFKADNDQSTFPIVLEFSSGLAGIKDRSYRKFRAGATPP